MASRDSTPKALPFLFNIMEELVFRSEKGNPVTSSKLVAKKFKKNHKDVLKAIRNLVTSDDWYKRNFALIEYQQVTHSPIIKDKEYIMTRDGFSILVFGFTGEKALKFKIDFIEAFNKMEQALNKIIPDFNNPVEAARAWADEVEKKQLAEIKVKELEPKAESFDIFIDSKSLQGFKEVANMLGYGRNKLMSKLRILCILTHKNIPYQRFLNMKLFEVKESQKELII